MHNEFEKEEKYKLYRSVKEILHPTISKKNISNYKIIISEDQLPVRIFYPKKVTNINNVVFYIHGDSRITECHGKYSEISSRFSKIFNSLVISIDYSELKDNADIKGNIYKNIKYIYDELQKEKISHISLIGDSTGANVILNCITDYNITNKMQFDNIILFYPVIPKTQRYNKYNDVLISNIDRFYNDYEISVDKVKDKILLIVGNGDPLLKDINNLLGNKDNIEIHTVSFAEHGFLCSSDKEIVKEYKSIINNYLNAQ